MYYKIIKRLIRYFTQVIQFIRILFYRVLSTNHNIKGKPNQNQPILFLGQGLVEFEGKVNIGCYPSPYFFNSYAHIETRGKNSSIRIENGTWINNNSVIIADGAKINIGKNVLIGTSLNIYTSDFHGLQPDKRISLDYPKEDVIIEDNVFIGSNVIILKGVKIGKNSVIASGSIVSRNVPENVIAGGIPCKIIKAL